MLPRRGARSPRASPPITPQEDSVLEPNDTLQPDHVRTAAEWSMLVNEVSAARLRLEDANARAAIWLEKYQALAVEHEQLHVDTDSHREEIESVVRTSLDLLTRARAERVQLIRALAALCEAVKRYGMYPRMKGNDEAVILAMRQAREVLTLCEIPF